MSKFRRCPLIKKFSLAPYNFLLLRKIKKSVTSVTALHSNGFIRHAIRHGLVTQSVTSQKNALRGVIPHSALMIKSPRLFTGGCLLLPLARNTELARVPGFFCSVCHFSVVTLQGVHGVGDRLRVCLNITSQNIQAFMTRNFLEFGDGELFRHLRRKGAAIAYLSLMPIFRYQSVTCVRFSPKNRVNHAVKIALKTP